MDKYKSAIVIDFPNLPFMPWVVNKLNKLEIFKVKDLKTTNRDRKSNQTRYELQCNSQQGTRS